jgi:hypothetical protein
MKRRIKEAFAEAERDFRQSRVIISITASQPKILGGKFNQSNNYERHRSMQNATQVLEHYLPKANQGDDAKHTHSVANHLKSV